MTLRGPKIFLNNLTESQGNNVKKRVRWGVRESKAWTPEHLLVVWMRMASRGFIYLNAWSSSDRTVWEELGSVVLLKKACHWI